MVKIGQHLWIERKHPMLGKKHNKESKIKMSISHIGKTSWNKGRKIQTNTGRTHFKKGFIPWNKGLVCSLETKNKISKANKGRISFWKGKKLPIDMIIRISESLKGRKSWNKGLKGYMPGEKHYNWKGGVSKCIDCNGEKSRYAKRCKVCNSKGILNNSWKDGVSLNKKIYRQKKSAERYIRFKSGGKLPIETIQLIYEDNIKYYGCLTCSYCNKNINFGDDTIDHKIPLIKNGTNEYSNLTVACRNCNLRKNKKTDEEFRKVSLND